MGMMWQDGASARPGAGRPDMLDIAAFRTLGFARQEDEAIWTRDWICIGTRDDVAATGDVLPYTIGDHAMHVQRGADGGLAGRFNKAQHGGCRVVPLQCQQGTKTPCSFTSCGHSRDRKPISAGELGDDTPEMYQYLGLRPERLLPVRVAEAGSLLFAHLDPHGEEIDRIASALADFAPTIAREGKPRLFEEWLEFGCNWKLAGQFIAGIDTQSPSGCADMLTGETLLGRTRGRAAWLFPNLVVLKAGDAICVVLLQPTALTRTLCRVHVFGDDGPGWRNVINSRGIGAARSQSAVDAIVDMRGRGPVPVVSDPAARWLCDRVVRRFDAHPLDSAANELASFIY